MTTPERWSRVEAVFTRALELDAAARTAFLAEACAGDADLRREVEELLAEHDAAPGFLTGARAWLAGAGPATDPTTVADADELPDRIGPYRVIRLVGRGGMGRVFLAERRLDDVVQLVALKLMRRGLDTDDLIARFRAERRILARLEHPNIARLLDVGATDAGAPYLVMEYVDGTPILEYCERAGLDVPQRLALFLAVCAAVQYAHRSLVVHRDLKPGNILVTAEGVPKLLDFGIAKVLDPGEDDASGATRADVRVMTPGYAAPEQVRGDAITTACDVYALGVLLYELLTGVHPYGAGRTRAELERLAVSADPPPPSSVVPPSSPLRRRIRGDLDTIAGRAMRREPELRYPSALSLAEDIDRHLRALPVRARPPALGYRVRKFVRRNRVAVGAATVLALVLAGSAGFALHQHRRILHASARVERERDKALQVRSFLLEMFGTTGPDQPAGDTVSARQLLDRQAVALATMYAGDPDLRAEMTHVLAESYERLGLIAAAEPLAREALAMRRALPGPLHPDVVASLNLVGWLHRQKGELEPAEALIREAVETGERLFPADGDRRLARALNDLGVVREARGDTDEAAALYTRSLEMRRRLLGEAHIGVAITTSNLAVVRYRQGDLDAAAELGGEALELFRRILGPDHQRTTVTQNNLAAIQSMRGDHAGAALQHADILERRRRAFGERHPSVAHSMTMLANELIAADRAAEAEPLLERALEIQRQAYGPQHGDIASTLRVLGDLKRRTGRDADALADYGAALAIIRATVGASHRDVVLLLARRAAVHEVLGDLDSAEQSFDEAARVAGSALGADHPRTLDNRLSLLELRQRRGRGGDVAAELSDIEERAGRVDGAAADALRDRVHAVRSATAGGRGF